MTDKNETKAAKRNSATQEEQRQKLEKQRAERLEKANKTANQNADEGNENEVQGKLAVPKVEVMKRGQVKYTDDEGRLVKRLANADEREKERPTPDYIKLHQSILEGADPLEAERNFQSEKVESAKPVESSAPRSGAEENGEENAK